MTKQPAHDTQADEHPKISLSAFAYRVHMQREALHKLLPVLVLMLALVLVLLTWWFSSDLARIPGASNALTMVALVLSIPAMFILGSSIAMWQSHRLHIRLLATMTAQQSFGPSRNPSTLLELTVAMLAPRDQTDAAAVRAVLTRVIAERHTTIADGWTELAFINARAALREISSKPGFGSDLQATATMLLTRLETGSQRGWRPK